MEQAKQGRADEMGRRGSSLWPLRAVKRTVAVGSPTRHSATRVRAAGLSRTVRAERTRATFRIKGHAFHPAPVRFREAPNGTVRSFSISFVFGILSSFGDIRGHGFAFFIALSTDLSAAFPIQFLGLINATNNGSTSNHLFAVELDTIQNTEFGDIDNNHVGVDINSLNSVKSNTAGFYNDELFYDI
ncbi:L-type lectin-domain containing receptor kinase V.9 [Triticum urartu]|uniref:L-type lectin-domain containing receptor kinase V.9 n=1 Tax=Triticum urartu TaxID=4572 RepID=M7YNJ0_TRIUA|nr:L-type lectin-domain containing receptor kinase V.9 [Triticum urartu]